MSIKKNWLSILLFVLVFGGLVALSSIFDWQVSSTLADLDNGAFFTNNFFGVFVEVIGSFPIYYFIGVSLFCFAFNTDRFANKKLALVLFFASLAGALLAMYIGVDDCMKDFADHSAGYAGWDVGFKFLLCFAIALIFFAVTLLFFKKLSASDRRRLLIFGIVTIGMVIISQIIIYILKPLAGRLRYRGISVLGDEYSYAPWYKFNGSVDKEAVLLANPELLTVYDKEVALDIIRDSFRSFPSGHTASSAAVYALLYLPFCFEKLNTKKAKLILNVSTVAFTGMVAIGRIVAGAHYFSDVLFGGTITYLSLWASALIFEKLRVFLLSKEQKPLTPESLEEAVK